MAVVKISASPETFPARYLFPFSIYASRNLLGPLVSNKTKEFLISILCENCGFLLIVSFIEKLQ